MSAPLYPNLSQIYKNYFDFQKKLDLFSFFDYIYIKDINNKKNSNRLLTKKLHITNISDKTFITKKQEQFSFAFRYLHKRIEEHADPTFENYLCKRFDLNTIEFRSLLSQVKSFIAKNKSAKETSKRKLEDKSKLLANLEKIKNPTKQEKRDIFTLKNDISFLKRSINNNCVFGGKKLLSEISYISNQLAHQSFESKEELEEKEELKAKLSTKKQTFSNNRILAFQIMGEANQKGNRFFDFSQLEFGKVIYKPNSKTKIEINFLVPKNQFSDLCKLRELSEQKEISLSISISETNFYIAYDELIVSGYNFDEKSYQHDLKKLKCDLIDFPKEEQSKQIKGLKKSYFDEQKERMLVGKKGNRVFAIDLNPEYIGYSVIDRISNTKQEIKIISSGCYDLSKLCQKLPKNATDEERKYWNNKRKHEISQVIKYMFDLAIHFGCCGFVMEDLEFESEALNSKSKEANRKTKNIWNRGLVERLILKNCNKNGIELIKVNCAYSSFIGNMMYDKFDPISASIEIGRRGLYRYIKNLTGYPEIAGDILNTLVARFEELGGDVSKLSTGGDINWRKLYNASKEFRWRRAFCEETNERSRIKNGKSGLFMIR